MVELEFGSRSSNSLELATTFYHIAHYLLLAVIIQARLSVKPGFYYIEWTGWNRCQGASHTGTHKIFEVGIVLLDAHEVLDFLVEENNHGAKRYIHHIVDPEATIERYPSLVPVHLFNQIPSVKLVTLRSKQLKSLLYHLSRRHY